MRSVSVTLSKRKYSSRQLVSSSRGCWKEGFVPEGRSEDKIKEKRKQSPTFNHLLNWPHVNKKLSNGTGLFYKTSVNTLLISSGLSF